MKPLLRLVDDWQELLASGVSEEEYSALRKHERIFRDVDTYVALHLTALQKISRSNRATPV